MASYDSHFICQDRIEGILKLKEFLELKEFYFFDKSGVKLFSE